MHNIWNERYSIPEYVYGEKPNEFFAQQLQQLQPNIIILPCEGEGRNAVFAASCNWKVHAFDTSEAGKIKALQLANKMNLDIDYVIEDAMDINYANNSAAVIALIYAHFPASNRKFIHQRFVNWLKPGGRIILEAFNPHQMQNTSGGPKDVSMLYTEEMLADDFKGLHIELLKTTTTILDEGAYHQGEAAIIQLVGIKK
ncbi:MAG: class I SAM-dependent methyltransferase [Ferruginibacter sp.]